MKSDTNSTDKLPKVLFYTSIPRVFRTTLIGYVYELAQQYPVVLLSEKLDEQTEQALVDKELFPKLEAIVPVSQYSKIHKNIFLQNRKLASIASKAVEQYKPDVVVTANDVYPFELYLHRAAKRKGAVTMCFQGSYRIAEEKDLKVWDRTLFGNSLFRKTKKYIGHFVYYWLFPLLLGERPFRERSSFVRLEDDTGFRVDWSVVFSKRDYDICVKEGVPQERLLVLDHPIRRGVKKVFEIAYGKRDEQPENQITFLLPNKETGLRKADLSRISSYETWTSRKRIIELLSEIFPTWPIWVKPHPSMENMSRAKKELEPISSLVKVVQPGDPVDQYVGKSKIVVGIPIDSTALFTASLESEDRAVISVDIHQELLGDSFEHTEGVTYVQTLEQLREVLRKIRARGHKRRSSPTGSDLFQTAPDVVNFVYEKRNRR